MSYTEIYRISKTGNVRLHEEVKNSLRGAMAVWMELEKKYLPPYVPYWFKPTTDRPGTTRMASTGLEQEVWDLWKDERMSRAERIVMCSTFDNVYVASKNFARMQGAFNEFWQQFPYTSYSEQARIISDMAYNRNIHGICWNQTSISEGYYEYGPNGGQLTYNIHKSKRKHWELFEGHPELL